MLRPLLRLSILAAAIAVVLAPAAHAGVVRTGGDGLVIQPAQRFVPGDLSISVTLRFPSSGSPVWRIGYNGNVLENPLDDLGEGCRSVEHHPSTGTGVIECERTVPEVLIDGGDRPETITLGGSGVDIAANLPDKVTFAGGDGDDRVFAGNGKLVASLDAGNDRSASRPSATGALDVTGGPGGDILNGGAGNDDLNGGSGNDTVTGAAGDDTVGGGGDADRLLGSDGSDVLSGGTGNDTLTDEPGRDELRAGSGDDTLIELGTSAPGDGSDGDVLDGSLGFDRLSYATRLSDVDVLIDGNANDGGGGERDNVIGIDSVVLGSGDDSYFSFADEGPDVVVGGPGDDALRPGGGPDTLTGGPGVDVLLGGTGDDVINAGGDSTRESSIGCASGSDLANIDLVDAGLASGCETIQKNASDEPRSLAIRSRARVSGGRTLVLRTRCRRERLRREPCHGRLTIRRGARKLGTVRYKLREGAKRTLRVTLGAAPGRHPKAFAREPGRKGPRTTSARLDAK